MLHNATYKWAPVTHSYEMIPKRGGSSILLQFERISTWHPSFVAAILAHYPGSRGAPVGQKLAYEIRENAVHRGWIGLAEPAYKLAARRRLGLTDGRPLPGTVSVFMYRLDAPGHVYCSEILDTWHEAATKDWLISKGEPPVHWESMVDPTKVAGDNPGACFKAAGYRTIGETTGRTAKRPPGHTHTHTAHLARHHAEARPVSRAAGSR